MIWKDLVGAIPRKMLGAIIGMYLIIEYVKTINNPPASVQIATIIALTGIIVVAIITHWSAQTAAGDDKPIEIKPPEVKP